MKTHLSKVMVMGLSLLVVQACAGPPKKQTTTDIYGPQGSSKQQPGKAGVSQGQLSQAPQKEEQPGVIGQVQSETGNAEITQRKQVTVTEKTVVPSIKTSKTRADLNRVKEDHLIALGAPKAVA